MSSDISDEDSSDITSAGAAGELQAENSRAASRNKLTNLNFMLIVHLLW
jgi:hypothetical protein